MHLERPRTHAQQPVDLARSARGYPDGHTPTLTLLW